LPVSSLSLALRNFGLSHRAASQLYDRSGTALKATRLAVIAGLSEQRLGKKERVLYEAL
jgi:hypothetical protein